MAFKSIEKKKTIPQSCQRKQFILQYKFITPGHLTDSPYWVHVFEHGVFVAYRLKAPNNSRTATAIWSLSLTWLDS